MYVLRFAVYYGISFTIVDFIATPHIFCDSVTHLATCVCYMIWLDCVFMHILNISRSLMMVVNGGDSLYGGGGGGGCAAGGGVVVIVREDVFAFF